MVNLPFLLKSFSRRQKSTVTAIFCMITPASLCVFVSAALFLSGKQSVAEKMDSLGFGDFTLWLTDAGPDAVQSAEASVSDEIARLDGVVNVAEQKLIYSGYEIAGKYSDNEGELILPGAEFRYRFIDEHGGEVTEANILPGEIYISPALKSSFDVSRGSKINFPVTALSGGTRQFTVAGFFEDPFMGSSMIDMKSFLISAGDFFEIERQIFAAGENNALAKSGAMIHIKTDDAKSPRQMNKKIQSETRAPLFTVFSYTRDSILNCMILLQNILCGLMFVFSFVLLAAVFIVTAHALAGALEQEKKNTAVFKTLGIPVSEIRLACIFIYAASFAAGIIAGAVLVLPVSRLLADALVSSTGLLVETAFPKVPAALFSVGAVLLLAAQLFLGTRSVASVSPVRIFTGKEFSQDVGCVPSARAGEKGMSAFRSAVKAFPVRNSAARFAVVSAIREVRMGAGRYLGISLISVLLVIFLAVIGKMTSWLGPNGEGLMDAFSVAEYDLGVQPYSGNVPTDEIERAVNWYSPVKEKYELAMQTVVLEGFPTTANVLNDTKYFHILSGRRPRETEILITHMIAGELDLRVGDQVQVSAHGRTARYTVSGIYACANGMGNNIGMSTEGYSKLGDVTAFIWCVHFIQESGGFRDDAAEFLRQNYSGIDVHTNGWSGLDGIVRLMRSAVVVIYGVATVIVLISALLAAQKILRRENRNLAVYKSLGFTNATLRLSFAARFLLAVAAGGFFGTAASLFLSDPLISAVFTMLGIGGFSCGASFLSAALPVIYVSVMFTLSAWIFSGRIRRAGIVRVIAECGE